MAAVFKRLLTECLDRTGRVIMLVTIALGMVASLVVAGQVRLVADFWANLGLWLLIGALVSFLVDLLFISPLRLWRDAEQRLAEKDAVGLGLTNHYYQGPVTINYFDVLTQEPRVFSSNAAVIGGTATADAVIFARGTVPAELSDIGQGLIFDHRDRPITDADRAHVAMVKAQEDAADDPR